ncbi:putative nuclease HARBI1 [Rhagoletis pomonella]|uniref:putative nuclease HARBI1 n=1 Tax=Rhagoletis pomonella TaxID=28610 RepID=UPI0017817F74|nr:putative nuclease HARBI1 [Rhagoletis pomonella]
MYLGDSGYPLQPYLMTPFRNASAGIREFYFNKKHAKARNIVKRAIAVLKCCFRCLSTERKLHYSPQEATKIINACCVLHNICLYFKMTTPEEVANYIEPPNFTELLEERASTNDGERRRNEILLSLF